jgi:hypothetical protein
MVQNHQVFQSYTLKFVHLAAITRNYNILRVSGLTSCALAVGMPFISIPVSVSLPHCDGRPSYGRSALYPKSHLLVPSALISGATRLILRLVKDSSEFELLSDCQKEYRSGLAVWSPGDAPTVDLRFRPILDVRPSSPKPLFVPDRGDSGRTGYVVDGEERLGGSGVNSGRSRGFHFSISIL